jgi:hypothetical protein
LAFTRKSNSHQKQNANYLFHNLILNEDKF